VYVRLYFSLCRFLNATLHSRRPGLPRGARLSARPLELSFHPLRGILRKTIPVSYLRSTDLPLTTRRSLHILRWLSFLPFLRSPSDCRCSFTDGEKRSIEVPDPGGPLQVVKELGELNARLRLGMLWEPPRADPPAGWCGGRHGGWINQSPRWNRVVEICAKNSPENPKRRLSV